MTIRQKLEAILNLYLLAIEAVKDMEYRDEIKDLLNSTYLGNGLCHVCYNLIDEPYSDTEKRLRHAGVVFRGRFIGPTPADGHFEKDAAITALKRRVRALRKVLY